MTIEEAIKHCNDVAGGALCEGTVNHKARCEEHRQFAEWLQDYKILKDKATPKSPYFEGDGADNNGNIIYDNWICPCCDGEYETKYEEYDYCPSCGQAILWEDKQ